MVLLPEWGFIRFDSMQQTCLVFQVEQHRLEVQALKHSLRDSETLLLDANRALSQRSQVSQACCVTFCSVS